MSAHESLVKRIAAHSVELRYEDLPEEAIEMAKWLIFDTIGTGLGGYQRDLGKKAVRYAKTMMPGDAATLLGDGSKVSIEGAAFANGVMVKILGMDDSHRSGSHIASQMVPTVLAVSEAYGTSGEEILTAIVGAYDFAVRVGSQVRHWQRDRGFDIKGTVGTIASAIAAARCAGLSFEQTCHAIGMAADLSSGTEQYVYEGGKCETKDLIAGFAARNGVFAMRLAESGFYGPDGALDGDYGFFRAFGDGVDMSDFDDLGQRFSILSTGFKPHGGCRHTHQAIDAVQALQSQHSIDPEQIAHIRVRTYVAATQPIFRVNPNPPSREVAGLSIRVSTAVALARGSAMPDDFMHWDDPLVRSLRQMMDVEVDPEIEAHYPDLNGCHLDVTMKSGEVYSTYLPNMKGEPEFRMSAQEIEGKFAALTKRIMSSGQVTELFGTCLKLETLPDIRPIISLTTEAHSTTEEIHAK